ncbi:ARC19 [Sanghuangporus weigelae]
MSNVLRPYLAAVRSTLTAALTVQDFPSQVVERHNFPEVEVRASKEVLLNPLTISRNENERVLVEPSINSIRVSIKIKQADEIERILCHKFTRFMMQRAEGFIVLRRKPVPGYDISFLITNNHSETMLKHKVVDFIITFMEEVDKEISEMKLSLNARARIVAESYLSAYSKSSRAKCNGPPPCKSTNIDIGALRYGQVSLGDYGEQIKWRHWGCVTPAILRELAIVNLDRVPGFGSLKHADQAKIRRAIARKQVDPEDVPASANTLALPPSTQPSNLNSQTGKRKASSIAGPSSSQASSSPQAPTTHRSTELMPNDVIEVVDDEDEPDPETRDELYCVLETQVVGVQYYAGMVGPGEEVRLERQPHNQYDRWAIRVGNIAGTQVGHLPRNVVSRLSPLLDRNLISVEGIMVNGNLSRRKVYSMPITIKIYGASDKRNELEPLLVWATPGQRGFPPPRPGGSRDIPGLSAAPRTHTYASYTDSQVAIPPGHKLTPEEAKKLLAQREQLTEAMEKASELRSILGSLEKVDDENRRNSVLDTLCSAEDVINLPEHPNPPGLATGDLTVNLLKHQIQGLQWCIDKEYPKLPTKESDKPVQFWQVKKTANRTYYYNLATKTPQEAVPALGRGALCADSMGLGKTLTMLALILATKSDVPSDYSRATLIVVPLSLISNWEGQINEHCKESALSYHVYYGAGRSVNPSQLKKYDVVITTYQVVVSEHTGGARNGSSGPSKRQKTGSGLFGVSWKRVILDEGHIIRNPKTKMARAVSALEAQRRWILTGTPIINTPRDLGSILTFLQICKPLDSEDFFKRLIIRPLKDGSPEGYQLLRALMSQICIRRTKEMHGTDGKPLVPLPGIEMITIPVTLDPSTRELYDKIEDLSKQRFQNLMDEQGSMIVSSHILSMLTRLRQVVLHPGLIPSNYVQQMRESLNENNLDKPGALIKVTPELKLRLQATLARLIEDSEECPICFEVLNDPRITGCAHAFCLECITEIIARDARCPMDRRQITMADLVEPAPPGSLVEMPSTDEVEDTELRAGSSAKIEQLLKLLQLTPNNEKSLVFSQFTSFLDKIESVLSKAGIPYVRFDGKMSVKERQATLERFNVPLDEDEISVSQSQSRQSPPPSAPSRTTRKKKTKTIVVDSDIEDGKDENFSNNRDNDSDDSFLDDDLSAWTKKPKGKGKAKMKAAASKAISNGGAIPKVMLISLKAGSLGLNLTVANNVYLMDPWWQEGIESQAIDRCNRIGQKKTVHVYQLIAENTVESKVIDIQERKKKLINEAFSGIKNATTQRQKREARMQDLIELFGLRQKAASQSRSQTTLDRFGTSA